MTSKLCHSPQPLQANISASRVPSNPSHSRSHTILQRPYSSYLL